MIYQFLLTDNNNNIIDVHDLTPLRQPIRLIIKNNNNNNNVQNQTMIDDIRVMQEIQ